MRIAIALLLLALGSWSLYAAQRRVDSDLGLGLSEKDAPGFLLHLLYHDPTDQSEEGKLRKQAAESYLEHLAREEDLTEDEKQLLKREVNAFGLATKGLDKQHEEATLELEGEDPDSPKGQQALAKMANVQSKFENLIKKHSAPILASTAAKVIRFIEKDIRRQNKEGQ